MSVGYMRVSFDGNRQTTATHCSRKASMTAAYTRTMRAALVLPDPPLRAALNRALRNPAVC